MRFALLLAGLWLHMAAVVLAEPRAIRLQAKPPALQTAIVELRGPGGARIDLVAAVHLGDAAYYRALRQLFRGYDAVLYELVKPEEFEPGGPVGAQGTVGGVQARLKQLLGLRFQLEEIDYGAANFIHADMASEQLIAALREHPGRFLAELMRWTVGDSVRLRSADGSWRFPTLELARALLSRDRPLALRKVLARELAEMGDLAAGSSLLIGQRNAIAVQVARHELKQGRRRLAVFYGAAHLPDLEKRLVVLGFRRMAERWLTAWDLAPP